MFELRKLSSAIMLASALFCLPSLGLARAPYQAFVVTPEQVHAAASEDYRRCVTLAGVNTVSKSNCDSVEQRLVNRRLEVRYRAVLAELTGDSARAYRVGHQSWMRIRDRDCAGALRKLFNHQDMDNYVKQVTKCRLDESLRRTVWLELN